MNQVLKWDEKPPAGVAPAGDALLGITVNLTGDFGAQPAPQILSEPVDLKPQRQTVTFDNPENPTPEDLRKLAEWPVCDHFELRNGKIGPKYVPIREKVKDPAGRTDYGWSDEKRRAHLKAAHARGWKEFPWITRPHDGVALIVGGGPSLVRTLPELRRFARKKRHFIITTNKTHDFLLNLPKLGLGQAIKPWGAVLLDPCDWVKDYITPREGIQYLIGDQCAPATFDVFEKPGISRWIWRSTNHRKDHDIVPQRLRPVFGGSTGGMRCRTLMYFNGFRTMRYFGFDSSCEDDKLHGYEKWDSVKDRLSVKIIDEHGFEREFTTNSHMARQAQEWLEMREQWIANYREGKCDWVEEIFHGDGLLPTLAARLGQHADAKRNLAKTEILTRDTQVFTTDEVRRLANAG